MSVDDLTKHDRAYLCFLPTGFLGLLLGVFSNMPMDTGTAGGVGLLVLVPLALLALRYLPTGIYLAFRLRKDAVLPALTVLTVLWIVQFFIEAVSPTFRSTINLIYGLLVVALAAHWFFRRRRQAGSA